MNKEKKSLNKKSIKNKIALFCTFLSFTLFFPGISMPMLAIRSTGKIETSVTSDLSIQFFKSSNSILHAVHDLFIRDYKFVACMIFLFSVIVPILKSILFGYVLITKKAIRKKIFNFIKSISKWAMCDVYVVAIFLTYLSTSGSNRRRSHEILLNDHLIDVDVLVQMTSKLGVGFYYFLAYCLLALVSFHLYDDSSNKVPPLLHKH
ncbi:MAG: hypothetical protein RLZ35_463 [Pseudomonadota bacterium]